MVLTSTELQTAAQTLGLEQLIMHRVLTLHVDYPRLMLDRLPSSFSRLHTLSLRGASEFQNGGAQFVTGLTGLRCLHWRDTWMGAQELRGLTVLTRLTELLVDYASQQPLQAPEVRLLHRVESRWFDVVTTVHATKERAVSF